MIISKELGYFAQTDLDLVYNGLERESKLISGLIKFFKKKSKCYSEPFTAHRLPFTQT